MGAPDKIYVNEYQNGDYSTCWDEKPHGFAHELAHELESIGTKAVCYIRKDVLLEWVNKRLEEFRHIAEISNDVAADGEVNAFEELIDKLNSM